ncbi:MAG: nucleotidyltransferase family protein [Candidatus Firestonebacteria bacterium]|nr:nucleotidyltransferase family protein [Candidatus Firestonebacteria bacterium]
MKYSAEEKFLIAACVLAKPAGSGAYPSHELDWDKLVAIAEANRLGFYLDKAIKTHKLKVNRKYLEEIKKLKKREKARYAYFREKLPLLLKVMNKTGLPYAVLKGGYLAFALYPAGARFLSDIDILVPEEGRAAAAGALLKAGFQEDKNKSDKVTTVLKDLLGLEVELSSELGQLKRILPAKELLQNTARVRLLGEKAYVLNNEYNLLHLCLHCSMTHSFYDLAKLVDINEYLNKYGADTAKLEKLARKKGVFRACFIPVGYTGIFWHNKIGLRYNIPGKLAGYFIEYNLNRALRAGYNRLSAFYGFILPVLLADTFTLKFCLVKDYLVKKAQRG